MILKDKGHIHKFHPESNIIIITVKDYATWPFMINYTKSDDELITLLWKKSGNTYIVNPLAYCQCLVEEYCNIRGVYKLFRPTVKEWSISETEYKSSFYKCKAFNYKMNRIYNK